MLLVQVQKLGTGTKHDLETLHHFGKRVKIKSQKVLGASSFVHRNSAVHQWSSSLTGNLESEI